MAAKLLIVLICAVAGTYCGILLSKRLKDRRRYFEDLITLIHGLGGDMRFRQSGIKKLLSEIVEPLCADLKANVTEFISYTETGGKLEISKNGLNDREAAAVYAFFGSIGNLDLDTQLIVLENHAKKFAEFYNAAAEKEKKFASLYVKLGFLFGLALGILTL